MIPIEVRINKEVRDYQESLFFGLSLRQLIFALLAVLVAVGVYFGLRGVVGSGEIGWICVLAAFPFALGGFFTYNGMTFEKFLLAFIRSDLLYPKAALAALRRAVTAARNLISALAAGGGIVFAVILGMVSMQVGAITALAGAVREAVVLAGHLDIQRKYLKEYADFLAIPSEKYNGTLSCVISWAAASST